MITYLGIIFGKEVLWYCWIFKKNYAYMKSNDSVITCDEIKDTQKTVLIDAINEKKQNIKQITIFFTLFC